MALGPQAFAVPVGPPRLAPPIRRGIRYPESMVVSMLFPPLAGGAPSLRGECPQSANVRDVDLAWSGTFGQRDGDGQFTSNVASEPATLAGSQITAHRRY